MILGFPLAIIGSLCKEIKMLFDKRPFCTFYKVLLSLSVVFILFSCQQTAREFVISQNYSSNLVFSEDSLSVDYLGTAYFKTEKALELYSDGIVASIKNDFPLAEKKLKAALKLEPDNYNILVGLGNVYANEIRLNQALDYYNQAISVSDSIYPGVFLNIAKVYSAQDEFPKALTAIEYVVQIGDKKDYILQVMVYYQLTGVNLALLDCIGAERSFNIYDNLTKNDNRFNALKNKILKHLVNCAGDELRQEYVDPETGELFASSETIFLDQELGGKQWVTLITLLSSKTTVDEMVINKKFFRDYLYTEFYNNSEIVASGFTGKQGSTLYAVTDLASTKGRNKARISYKLELEKEYSTLKILQVTYSHPDENVTVPENI